MSTKAGEVNLTQLALIVLIWLAIGLEQRWKLTHKKCLFAILKQVDAAQKNIVLDVDIDDYIETRRHSIGAYSLFAVVE